MASIPYKASINLALETIQKDKNLSLRAAAKIYDATINTIRNRRDGKLPRRDLPANSLYAIISTPLGGVGDMANQLLRARDMLLLLLSPDADVHDAAVTRAAVTRAAVTLCCYHPIDRQNLLSGIRFVNRTNTNILIVQILHQQMFGL
ncbi:hypothetical protein V502_02041 [Pseudogymnoascus sp. VKM F-4520 (FW-2644)]|nr:hypothetical protein V502_02041 [Pseudogymnoascus sp. VKM F-4520 (FW-2644)]